MTDSSVGDMLQETDQTVSSYMDNHRIHESAN